MNTIKTKNKTYLCLCLPRELREEIDKEADKLGLTTNAYIRMILIKRNK